MGVLFFPRIVTIGRSQILVPTGMNQNFLNQVNECFLPTAAVYGYDLYVTSGFRSMADQAKLYSEGHTASGTIITEAPPGHSLHNYGYAVDVADRKNGYNIDWIKLIKIAAYCHLESGGPGDLPHFEYRGGLSTNDFAAGKRPQPLLLPCPVMIERARNAQSLTLKDLQGCSAPIF
jgi:hypothetical protein